MRDLRAHVQMMRVLQAEESLQRVTVIAAGNGLIKENQRGPIMAQWRREAMIGSEQKQKPTTLGMLIGNGVGVTFIKKGESLHGN